PAAVAVLEDPAATMGIAAVRAVDATGNFRPLTDRPLGPGFSASAWWQRFVLVNDTGVAQSFLFVVGEPTLDDLQLFRVRDGEVMAFPVQGRMAPAANRAIDFHQPVFVLDLPPGASDTYYLRTWSNSAMVMPLRLDTQLSFAEYRHQESLLLVLYGGVVLAMVVYNFFLYLTLRERSYLAYCASILAIFVTMVIVDGWSYSWLGDNVWLKQRGYLFSVFAAAISVLWFSITFLGTRSRLPRIDRAMRVMIWIYAGCACLALVYYGRPLVVVGDVLAVLTVPLAITAGVIVARQGHRPAIFYVFAWGATLIGALVTILASDGFVPPSPLLMNALKIGQVAEVMLMSFALAYRIRIVNDERDVALRDVVVAEARAEAKSQFLAHMSHEIRTPL
ncbi:MAG: 7TM diverse intracellular signaling domain-containing protein, partial [Actinomycetota bacterium]|nr:7TM diverse intracellular signaling domain-containing protein [Actinomycetota bacterium]